ncbi:MAG: hypothetical protein HQK91_09745 [Nitrospirae bacterium]|nr:hypothetical protein [Nitrospirota bacterium]MBF0541716.1 hypothetical protein [Nitrospirota bacterium]
MSDQYQNPVIIYSCKGIAHLVYAIWSIRSLQKFNYEPIEVIVANAQERDFFHKRLPDIHCTIMSADSKGYPAFSYKPFLLKKYVNELGFYHKDREILICDTDILWKFNPVPLFKRFSGKNWFHKITALNPKDYEWDLDVIPKSNIGLITTYHYIKDYGLDKYPNFRLNAGLFMMKEEIFVKMLDVWMEMLLSMSTDNMLMSEAILSLTFAKMGLVPSCDMENIKYLGIEKQATKLPIFSFEAVNKDDDSLRTGYETARHYYGGQRMEMFRDAKDMGLDKDWISLYARAELTKKWLKRLPQFPTRIKNKILKILNLSR